ncbi:hypothetical protein FA95DRAFT_1613430 [Auriscalpium vulgare]|uniref:Uncharacterized protein n=1 Tax=Auriscalpium vulgare TaxID=40419 RepID=A0ACB8R4B1_9AGAM|nr:hypothetical protein FA95DRAFT_1613430 [Auriscalpium vulgare]
MRFPTLPPGIRVLPNLESLRCIPVDAIDILQSILLSKLTGNTEPTLSLFVDVVPRGTYDRDIAALEELISVIKGLPPAIIVENWNYIEPALVTWRGIKEGMERRLREALDVWDPFSIYTIMHAKAHRYQMAVLENGDEAR